MNERDIYLTKITRKLEKAARNYKDEVDETRKNKYKLQWYKLLQEVNV